jgi:hypothetical protein
MSDIGGLLPIALWGRTLLGVLIDVCVGLR